MLNKESVLKIADKKLKDSYYRSKLKDGWEYGLLNFEYSIKEGIYNNREAYLIKVIGGEFGAFRVKGYKSNSNSILSKLKHIDGVFDKDSNIKCIVFKDNGEYKYLDNNK